jgi:hypothetical protein
MAPDTTASLTTFHLPADFPLSTPHHRQRVEGDHEPEERVITQQHAQLFEHAAGHETADIAFAWNLRWRDGRCPVPLFWDDTAVVPPKIFATFQPARVSTAKAL